MAPKRKASAPPGASSSAERGGASPAGNPKSSVGTADDDERSWSTLAARVRAHGGVVHANVRVGADASGARGLIAIGPIAEGATLFRIPETCTLTAASALRSPLGKAIAARAEAAVEDGTGYHARSRSLPLGDIALAAFVAADSVDPSSPFAAYHALLRRSPLDDAPAWWPRAQRETLLHVCLCKRSTACDCAKVTTRASRVSEALRKDAEDAFEALVRVALVEHVRDRFQNPRRDDQKRSFDGPFDTSDAWDAFRRALAAVHSRAFNFGEGDVPETRGASDASARTRSCDVPESSPDGAREALEREAAGSALVRCWTARTTTGGLASARGEFRQAVESFAKVVRSRRALRSTFPETPKRFNGRRRSRGGIVRGRSFRRSRVAYGARRNDTGSACGTTSSRTGRPTTRRRFSFRKPGAWRFRGTSRFPDFAIAPSPRAPTGSEAFSFASRHGSSTRSRPSRTRWTCSGRARERRGGGGAGGVDASRGNRSRPRRRARRSLATRRTSSGFPWGRGRGRRRRGAALMYGSGEESGEASGEEGKSTPRRGAKRKRGRRGPRGPRGFARHGFESGRPRGRAPTRGGCDRAVRPVGARGGVRRVFRVGVKDVPVLFPRGGARGARSRRRRRRNGRRNGDASRRRRRRRRRRARRRVRGAQAEERAFESLHRERRVVS